MDKKQSTVEMRITEFLKEKHAVPMREKMEYGIVGASMMFLIIVFLLKIIKFVRK